MVNLKKIAAVAVLIVLAQCAIILWGVVVPAMVSSAYNSLVFAAFPVAAVASIVIAILMITAFGIFTKKNDDDVEKKESN